MPCYVEEGSPCRNQLYPPLPQICCEGFRAAHNCPMFRSKSTKFSQCFGVQLHRQNFVAYDCDEMRFRRWKRWDGAMVGQGWGHVRWVYVRWVKCHTMAQSVWFDTKSSMVNGADVSCGESVVNPQSLLNTVVFLRGAAVFLYRWVCNHIDIMGTYHVTDITWFLFDISYHLHWFTEIYTFTYNDSDIVYICVSYVCITYIQYMFIIHMTC